MAHDMTEQRPAAKCLTYLNNLLERSMVFSESVSQWLEIEYKFHLLGECVNRTLKIIRLEPGWLIACYANASHEIGSDGS